MKKFVFVLVLIIALYNAFPVEAENNTNNNTPSSWASNYIDHVKSIPSLGIDKLDGNYQENITRGEFAYISTKLYEYYTGQKILDGYKCFKDTANEWVLKAKRAGLVNGYADNTYQPNNSIRREEIAVMFVNVLIAATTVYKEQPSPEIFADDNKISEWAKRSVYIAKSNNIINGVGDNYFDPSGFATREQAIVMLSKAVSTVTINILRLPRFGVDKIVLRDVESSMQNITLISGNKSIRVDKADYPFEPDDSLLGQWVSVDLVSDPLIFNPEKPQVTSLFLDSVFFYESGICEFRTYDYYKDGAWVEKSEYRSIPATWTKGLIMQNYLHEHTSSRYFLATLNDKSYLFIEYKNGDYIYRNTAPSYYVFTKQIRG